MSSTHSALLVEILQHVWHTLGLGAAVGGDEGFKWIVLAHFVKPSGKERVSQILAELDITGFSLRALLCCPACCADHDWRGGIQAALYQRLTARGDLFLVLYDMSTLYSETDKEDDLRKVGYSKECRVDPQARVTIFSHTNLTALDEMGLSRVVSSKISKAQRDAIEAHLAVVMASLEVARYLQDATGLSIKKVIRTLRPIQTA